MSEDNPGDPTRTHVTLTSGTMVSHYRIVEKIGAGGMGEVYLAEDTKLDRKVALKFLPLHLCQDSECRSRFTREAQAAAKLDHPNIVSVFEVGEFQGRPFFSMQHVEGQSLKEVIAGKALPLDRILEIGIQVCEGLQAAHENGITHRDIKPPNILIDSHGRTRIVDFGLASVMGSDHLTKTGSTMGTLYYMSPEQTRGEAVDERSDIFSLGVVLYEMITGQLPFKGDHDPAVIYSIGYEEPEPLARYKSGINDALQGIVSKALAKKVSLRYQTVAEVSTDLKRITSAVIKPRTPRRGPWNRHVVTSAVAVILVVAGYWGVNKFLIKESQEPEVTRKMLAVLPFENLGSPEDEYFADGITDEITGKLASIRDLGVISRTSTVQYKRTTKNLKQIAKELGVDYILEGSIRWDKGGTTSRVRILPQLIRVSDDTHLWAETFQRPLTDIFEIQADIADRIAAAMSIALGASEGAALRTIPTDNLEAYQAYLEGVFSAKKSEWTKEECLAGVAAFQRAVDLDSTFALAYARLSVAHSRMFHAGVDRTPERLHMAKSAVDRALELQPGLGWAHIALYYYHYWGFLDYEGALRELSLAENARPNDPELADLKGYIHRRQGKTQEAVTEMERAFRLNPRSATLANEIAWTYLTLRQYASADRYSDISTSLEPSQVGSYTTEAWVYLFWRGDTASARKVLAAIPDQDNDETHVAWYDYCILTRDYKDALRHLAYLPDVPHTSIDIFSPRALMEGVIYWCMNDRDRARAAFDSARMILESELVSRPDDHRIHSALGFAYAGLGRKQDAIREGIRGVELYPVSKDAYFGPQRVDDLADIYVMVGQYDEALEQFEYLLSIPYGFSVEWLRLDPRYDPLRDLPRYQKLVEKYGT